MPSSQNCAECQAIAKELAELYEKVSEELDNVDPATLEARLAEWKTLLSDGEHKGQTLPTVAPEIRNLNLLPTHDHPFAPIIWRKRQHESKTGHKVNFPKAAMYQLLLKIRLRAP